MANQKRVTLYAFNATPRRVVMRALPVRDANPTTRMYLCPFNAAPTRVFMKSPLVPCPTPPPTGGRQDQLMMMGVS